MPGSTKSSQLRCLPALILLAFSMTALMLAGCGKPFNVKPKPGKPEATYGSKVETDGVTLHAETLSDEDKIYDTFDANLVLAGILAVRIKVTNTGGAETDLKGTKFELRGQTNRPFKLLSPKKAYSRLLKEYGISFYNKHGNSQAKADFFSHALDVEKRLAAGEERDGLLFFQVPVEVIKDKNLTLVARNLKAGNQKKQAPVELKLN